MKDEAYMLATARNITQSDANAHVAFVFAGESDAKRIIALFKDTLTTGTYYEQVREWRSEAGSILKFLVAPSDANVAYVGGYQFSHIFTGSGVTWLMQQALLTRVRSRKAHAVPPGLFTPWGSYTHSDY